MPTVEIRGNTDLRKALRDFTPDLEKNLRKELRNGLKPVVAAARGFVPANSPMSGWATRSFNQGFFPTYNASTIIRGITYSTTVSKPNKNGFTSMARLMNKSAAGAIYETAGRKNPTGQPWVGPKGSSGHDFSHSNWEGAGRTFISKLPPLVSSLQGQGRLIYRAWAADKGKAHGIIMRAIDLTEKEFYARAATTTFSKAA